MPTPRSSEDPLAALRHKMRLEWRDPRTLQPNPRNPKRHSSFQRQAFNDFFNEVGWAGALLYNERTGRLLDGHLRQEDALERNLPEVPVLVVDVDEETETKILALHDKVGALFSDDADLLAALTLNMQLESEVLKSVLAGEGPARPELAPGAKLGDQTLPKGGLSLNLGESYNYVVLLFRSEMDWIVAQDHFGIERVRCIFTQGIGTGRVVDGSRYLRAVMADRFPTEETLLARLAQQEAERAQQETVQLQADEEDEPDVPAQA